MVKFETYKHTPWMERLYRRKYPRPSGASAGSLRFHQNIWSNIVRHGVHPDLSHQSNKLIYCMRRQKSMGAAFFAIPGHSELKKGCKIINLGQRAQAVLFIQFWQDAIRMNGMISKSCAARRLFAYPSTLIKQKGVLYE